MRILYCIPHLYNSGGMERVLTQKANWLVRNTEHSITILTCERTPDGIPSVYFPLDKRVSVVPLDLDFNADYHMPLLLKWRGHVQRMRLYQRALTHFIQINQIDLCISLGGKEVAFLRKLPCRTIVEMHFALDQRHQLIGATHKGRFWSWLGQLRTRRLVHDARPLSHLIVLTQADKTAWENAGCRNVSVIPNPCSLDGQKLPISSKKKTILAVGRLHEQKGFDLLLRAWASIEKKYPDWSLRIVGEGEKREELEAQKKTLGLLHVVLAGQAEEVAKEYAEASLFVMSSRYEGLPLALIEAMWCGLPCIAFDCPQGPSELLTDERGWLVPNGDVDKLTEQIEYVLIHPKEAAARATKAQVYARTTYSEAAIMPQWIKLIEKECN